VLHDHLERLLGVDLTDPDVLNSATIAAYAGPIYETYGNGFFTEAFAAQTHDALSEMAGSRQSKEPQQTDPEGTT
jgi:hypothetical protein